MTPFLCDFVAETLRSSSIRRSTASGEGAASSTPGTPYGSVGRSGASKPHRTDPAPPLHHHQSLLECQHQRGPCQQIQSPPSLSGYDVLLFVQKFTCQLYLKLPTSICLRDILL